MSRIEEEHQERHAGYPPGDDLPVSEGEPTREEVLEVELSQLQSAYDELAAQLQELTAERDALKKADEWQPIETAPKDGTQILAFCDPLIGQMVLFWDTPYWREKANMLGLKNEPTHWKPLHNPPAKEGE